jgi:hypothetical protein
VQLIPNVEMRYDRRNVNVEVVVVYFTEEKSAYVVCRYKKHGLSY